MPMRAPGSISATLLLASLALVAVTSSSAAASRRGAEPDWPCVQRLVPSLSPATFWAGPDPASAGDWTAEPSVATLVRQISPRRVTAEAGESAIASFADGIGSGDDRKRQLTLVFAGLLDETNRERKDVIERIKALGHRQNELAELASKASAELGGIPEDATGDAAAQRQDLQQRFTFVTRAYEGGRQTLRYVCEVPVQLEARLGRYARSLQAHF
jgi:hypothetical protein